MPTSDLPGIGARMRTVDAASDEREVVGERGDARQADALGDLDFEERDGRTGDPVDDARRDVEGRERLGDGVGGGPQLGVGRLVRRRARACGLGSSVSGGSTKPSIARGETVRGVGTVLRAALRVGAVGRPCARWTPRSAAAASTAVSPRSSPTSGTVRGARSRARVSALLGGAARDGTRRGPSRRVPRSTAR